MKEREQSIKAHVGTILQCRRRLKRGNLSECYETWLRREEKKARSALNELGINKIIGPDGGEEIVIFNGEENLSDLPGADKPREQMGE